jgi:hypothetical protein
VLNNRRVTAKFNAIDKCPVLAGIVGKEERVEKSGNHALNLTFSYRVMASLVARYQGTIICLGCADDDNDNDDNCQDGRSGQSNGQPVESHLSRQVTQFASMAQFLDELIDVS